MVKHANQRDAERETCGRDDTRNQNHRVFRFQPSGFHLLTDEELPSVVCKLPRLGNVALESCPLGREIECGHGGHREFVFIEPSLKMLREGWKFRWWDEPGR